MLSILVPTRNRPKNVVDLLRNLEETLANPKEVEVFTMYDEGEKQWKDSTSFNFYVLEREHSDFLNRDYYNYMASISCGDYLFSMGDDVRILTRNWNTILKERIEEYLKDKPDRIVYVSFTEKNSTAKHPCFPLITRESFNALNMFFHPEIMSWGADRCIYEIYDGIDRIFHIPEIVIEHLSYHDGSGVFDSTAKSMKERFFRNPNCHNEVSTKIIPKQIEILKQIINNKQKEK
jgi:hypothetical protein